ncbi:brassinosteroid-responsive RING protein 1-like [Harmonia axyridis]|uniref:brassinosteroid-responsive RING protein 1-like n=1 Tax=Harmonia axyridis TaxID=115357 RepID=UPI001E275A30|nr:brassinosteroid-responsive RING protein 1-like [Harmonia axyridis]XP_045477414.1 brassinosteroid-responsive RING protein 1-like [Harmonia axyridis]
MSLDHLYEFNFEKLYNNCTERSITFEEDCSVCLSRLTGELYLTDCGHSFHKECIDMWCSNSKCCPMCRTNLIFEETFSIFDTNWKPVNIHRFDKMDSDEEDDESEEDYESEEEKEEKNEGQTNEEI